MLRLDADPMTTAAAVIRLDGVARRFGQRWVLRGVDLVATPGEVIGMTGKNGSGKTTLLRIIATLLRPTRGSATVLGSDTVRDGAGIRGRVGLLGHNSALYDDLTATENLVFSMRMSGLRADHDAIATVLDRVGLGVVSGSPRNAAGQASGGPRSSVSGGPVASSSGGAGNERVRGFSAGMRRRLGLARLLLQPPAVLLLDEPYASFDADGIAIVNAFIEQVARSGGVVLLTTHDLGRADDIMTRRVHIEDGRVSDVHDGRARAARPGDIHAAAVS